MKSKLKVLLFFIITVTAVELFAQQPFVLIDSLCGKAEIQKAGKTTWIYVKQGNKLFHNDKIRLLDRSKARLRWPDGTTAHVHKNTQLLINILQNKPKSTLSHTTVFFGAVFFMIKNILPQEITNEMSIYTPDAFVKAKEASILVDAGKEPRYSNVKVFEGSADIHNVHKNSKLILTAPYQVTINMTDLELIRKVILQSDLDSIKEWIPEGIIEKIIARQ
ncbi:MAG: hypothetical protein GX640_18235, partial [Fibrobacter sp.]|nr:hypothetical protein [Fibrobacter sp.]